MDPVLVAGCGNAGLAAALELASRLDRSVIAVDPEPVMWFRSRYHRAVEDGDLDAVRLEVRPVLRERGVSFRLDRLVGVDPDDRVATFSSGDLRFSRLVVAVGAATRAPPAASDRLLSFRDDLLEVLDRLDDPDVKRVAVVGGGTTGLHAAAALAFTPGVHDVLLAHAGERILPSLPQRAARKARAVVEDRGVEVRTGARLAAMKGRKLAFQDAEPAEADLALWCGGIRPRGLLEDLPLPTTDRGLAVDDKLRCGSENVYVVGDAAARPEKIFDAYVGFQEARQAARNIDRDLSGSEPRPFRMHVHPRSLYLGGGSSGLLLRDRLWTGWIPDLVRRHVVEDGYDHMLRWVW